MSRSRRQQLAPSGQAVPQDCRTCHQHRLFWRTEHRVPSRHRPLQHTRSPSCAGAPAAPIKRSSPSENGSADFRPQKIIASLAWLKHASSTASELHSSRLSSVPTHFTLFAATGEPPAPHQLPLPYWPHGEGLATQILAKLSASNICCLRIHAAHRAITLRSPELASRLSAMTRTPVPAALPETCRSEPHNILSNLSCLTQQVNDAAAVHTARHKLTRQARRTSMTARTASSQRPSSDDADDPQPLTATWAHAARTKTTL